MIPAWLQRHLAALGRLNPDHISRAARPTRCRDCGATILAGLDADRCAWPARVDLDTLDVDGELAAHLTGRATYRLYATGARIEIDERTQFHIRLSPPGDVVVVVPEHRCGRRLGPPIDLTVKRQPDADTGEVPY